MPLNLLIKQKDFSESFSSINNTVVQFPASDTKCGKQIVKNDGKNILFGFPCKLGKILVID